MKFFYLVLVVLFMNSLVGAQTLTSELLSGSDSAKSLCIERLVTRQSTADFPLLRAIFEKNLYSYQSKLVTAQNKQTSSNGSEVYQVFEVHPDYIPLQDASSQPVLLSLNSLQAVEIGRSDRLKIAPLAPYLNLLSPETDKRKLAYGQLYDAPVNKLPLLEQAMKNEKDKDVLRLARESFHTIQLRNATSDAPAKKAIDALVANWGPNSQSLLEEYSQTTAPAGARQHAADKAVYLKGKHDMVRKAQNVFSGLSLGSILILIALGLSIIYGLAGIINMAHGEFLMIGAYTTFFIQELLSKGDLFFYLSLPLSFVMAGLSGFIIEKLIIRHLYARPLESLLATWGVSLVLVQMARSIFGDLTAVRTPSWLSGGWEVMPHLVLPYNRLFIICLTIIMIIVTYSMLYYSRLGMRIRAVTQNRSMSACLGIETRKVDSITFFLGAGLAGMAGCAMTLIGNVVPDMGQTYIVDSFLVVVTGGVGKIAGTIISGFGIGFITKFLESFFEAVYGKVLILVIIIMFLQFKPKGMFPDKGRIGDD